MKRRVGFTLVELLIVIVVLAILASISVVAYNGIQHRAETQKIESTIVNYIKTLEMYRAVHGEWPTPDPDYLYGAICLGPASDYPVADGFEAGQCFQNLNSPSTRGHAVSDIQDKLSEFTSGLHDNTPKKPWTLALSSNHRARGAHFQYLDGNFVQIVYVVPGERDCVTQGSNAGMSYQSRYMTSQGLTQCIIDMWI